MFFLIKMINKRNFVFMEVRVEFSVITEFLNIAEVVNIIKYLFNGIVL